MAHPKRICRQCYKRAATFRDKRGRYKSNAHHDICPQCYRSIRDRNRALRLKRDG